MLFKPKMKFEAMAVAAFVATPFLIGAQSTVRAYDSSGGRRTAELMARIDFIDYSPLASFPWDDSARALFRARLKRVLDTMPLDVADLPPIETIELANFSCAQKSAEDRADVYKSFCKNSGEWDGHSVHISAPIYDITITGRPSGNSTVCPEVVLHELVHAWELGSMPGTAIPEKTGRFYKLRYHRLAQQWESQQASNADWKQKQYSAAFNSCRQQNYPTFQERQCLETARSRIEGYVNTAANRSYQRLKLPSRWGGDTGRCLIENGASNCPTDKHPMDLPTEYLASLAEIVWADPPLAAQQYAPEELNWVRSHVFGNRPLPTLPASSPPRLKPAEMDTLRRHAGELSQTLQGQ